MSPLRSRESSRLRRALRRLIVIPGARRFELIIEGPIAVARVGNTPQMSLPDSPRWMFPISCSKLLRQARISAAQRPATLPASVGLMPREWRSSRGIPTARSSARICWDTADTVSPSCSAAFVSEPACTTDPNRSSMRAIISSIFQIIDQLHSASSDSLYSKVSSLISVVFGNKTAHYHKEHTLPVLNLALFDGDGIGPE